MCAFLRFFLITTMNLVKPKVHYCDALRGLKFSSQHNSPISIATDDDIGLICALAEDELCFLRYDRSSQNIDFVSKMSTSKCAKDACHDPSILLSCGSRKDKSFYAINDVGHIFSSNHFRDSSVDVLIPNLALSDDFKGISPHFVGILNKEDDFLVMNGIKNSIHLVSQEEKVAFYIKLGTYAASMSLVDEIPSVVATAEDSEVVLYDIRESNLRDSSCAQRFFTGPSRLLTVSTGPNFSLIASGYSRSLSFVDIRMNRLCAQISTKAKYEVNFLGYEFFKDSKSQLAFTGGTDAEFKIIDIMKKEVVGTFFADDCWCGRQSVSDGLVVGISCKGSLIVSDYRPFLCK